MCTLESGVHATIAGVALGLLTPARPVKGRRVLEELEHRLHPWSSFLIIPVFALANAGVDLGSGALGSALGGRSAWAVIIGLVVGKTLGITSFTALGVRARAGRLPAGVRFGHVVGAAALAGIGFDSPPVFCSLLDHRRGGTFLVAPDDVVDARQRYEPDSGVLTTEMRSPTGLVRVTDAMTLRSGADLTEDVTAARGELLRSVVVLDGEVRLRISVEPRGDATASRRGDGLRVRCHDRPDLDLRLSATVPLEGLDTAVLLRAGEQVHIGLRWGPGGHRGPTGRPAEAMQGTLDAWRAWMRHFRYEGPNEPLVRRSAVTLKLLDHFASGAIVAAPTSSLPEAIGGPRNWDYRFTWVRDAAFSVYALRRIGLHREAWGFLGWVLDAIDRDGEPRVMYDLDGNPPPDERIDPGLEGFRRSPPVRWGNAAAGQRQNDVYGEILDCAYQWASGGGTIDPHLWERLRALADGAADSWDTPDHGIWEIRTTGRVFTYSAALCHVALDRAAKLAGTFGSPGDAHRWAAEAARIRDAVLTDAWDAERSTLTEHLGGGGLDASLLALPLRRWSRPTTPRWSPPSRR